MIPRTISIAVISAGLLAGAALAHHSPARFDMTTVVEMDGTVAELQWRNPHIYFTIETTGADGQTLWQEIEAGAISWTRPEGLRREHLEPGSRIVVRVNPNRSGSGVARGLDIVAADGVVYPLNAQGRYSAPAPTATADSIAGMWVSPMSAVAEIAQIAPRTWALTDAARAVMVDPRATTTSNALCVALPPPLLSASPTLRAIEVGDSAVVIRFDADVGDVIRTVHLDQPEHPLDVEPSLLGHSIGRWEESVLVIDTVAFTPHRSGLTAGIPSGPGKHMVERLSLTEDRSHLLYEVTIEDPDHLSEPAAFSSLWSYRPDLEPSGEACDPEIAGRFLTEE